MIPRGLPLRLSASGNRLPSVRPAMAVTKSRRWERCWPTDAGRGAVPAGYQSCRAGRRAIPSRSPSCRDGWSAPLRKPSPKPPLKAQGAGNRAGREATSSQATINVANPTLLSPGLCRPWNFRCSSHRYPANGKSTASAATPTIPKPITTVINTQARTKYRAGMLASNNQCSDKGGGDSCFLG